MTKLLVASQWESARLFESEATQLRSALAKYGKLSPKHQINVHQYHIMIYLTLIFREVKRVAELKARVVKVNLPNIYTYQQANISLIEFVFL